MTTLKLQGPADLVEFADAHNKHFALDADGCVLADTRDDLGGFLRVGFVPAAASGTERPARVALGTPFFDTALGLPVWRTATGWCDATGAAR